MSAAGIRSVKTSQRSVTGAELSDIAEPPFMRQLEKLHSCGLFFPLINSLSESQPDLLAYYQYTPYPTTSYQSLRT